MDDGPARRSDLRRRIGYDRRAAPDVERLDEKLEDGLEEVPSEALSREPRAVRQALKKVWLKTRKGRAK